MRRAVSIILVLLMVFQVMFLSSCNNSRSEIGNTDTNETNSANTGSLTEEDPDEFAQVRKSNEIWLSYGLKAMTDGKNTPDLTSFFSSAGNLVYLTLFNDMFFYDKDNSMPVAEAFFSFVYEKYGVSALLDIDKRIEYKNEYLQSIKSSLTYSNPKDYEIMMSGMKADSDSTYGCIIQIGNATFYFKDFSKGNITQYHGLLYYNTVGIDRMYDYIEQNNLGGYFDLSKSLNFYMLFDGSGVSYTKYSGNSMYINDYSSMLHESAHAMGIQNNDNLWLSEGICEYLGKSLGFNEQIAAGYIQIVKMAQAGYYHEQAAAGNQAAILYINLAEQYVQAGGKTGLASEFDIKLYTDLFAKAQFGTDNVQTLAGIYTKLNGKDYLGDGGELTYMQAASFINWLVMKYGIEKTMTAYQSGDITGTFGDSYTELKSAWLNDLNS